MSNSREITHDQVDDGSLSLLLRLPSEIIVHILLFLPRERRQLASVALSCHNLFNMANDNILLKNAPKFDYSNTDKFVCIKTRRINASALSPNGRYLATCQGEDVRGISDDNIIQVFDTFNGQCINEITVSLEETRNYRFETIFFMKDEKHIIAVSSALTIAFSLSSNSPIKHFRNFGNNTRCGASFSNTNFLANSSSGLSCFNIITGEETTITNNGDYIDPNTIIISDDNRQAILLIIRARRFSEGSIKILKLDIESKLIVDTASNFKFGCSSHEFSLSFDNRNLFYNLPSPAGESSSIRMLNIDNASEIQLSLPINKFSTFKYFNTSDLMILGVEGKNHKLALDGLIVLKGDSKRIIGYIPYHDPVNGGRFLHMTSSGDKIIAINRGRREQLNSAEIRIYKLGLLNLNNEVIEDCEIPTIQPF